MLLLDGMDVMFFERIKLVFNPNPAQSKILLIASQQFLGSFI